MKISAQRSSFQQLDFFQGDEPLGNHGTVRNIIGNCAEELTKKVLRLRRHKTDSTCDYCPDLSRGSIYFESKAMGCSNQTFIYTGRLEKDREFAADNWLGYAIWWHSAKTKQAQTVGELRALFHWHLRGLFIVPFEAIETLCDARPIEPLNSKYGRSNEPGTLYGSGYRINARELYPWLFIEWEREQ